MMSLRLLLVVLLMCSVAVVDSGTSVFISTEDLEDYFPGFSNGTYLKYSYLRVYYGGVISYLAT